MIFSLFSMFDQLFGASKIPYSSITDLEKQSGDLIIWAIPFMAFFTLLEMWYSRHSHTHNYDAKESWGSLFVGLGNVTINLFFKLALIYGTVAIYNLVPWRMELRWWTMIPCLVIFDFCSYWAHRISHFNRFFWATHVVHHTAESYNLTVSFRLSWVQHFKILFFLPVIFMGFHPVVIFIVNQIAVLFQFWQHTEYIKKLPRFIEWLIVTPSNHRVHHGSNEKYLDKNFGVIFLCWDKLFKTYEPEGEKVIYGITTKIDKTINPLYLNFHEYKDIIKDVKSARSFREKLFYLFASPARIARKKSAMVSANTGSPQTANSREV